MVSVTLRLALFTLATLLTATPLIDAIAVAIRAIVEAAVDGRRRRHGIDWDGSV